MIVLLGSDQFYRGEPDATVDTSLPRYDALVSVAPVALGGVVSNMAITLDPSVIGRLDPPPSQGTVYRDDGTVLFSGVIDSIAIDDEITVTLRA